jgi:hypothetical protein
MAALRSTWARPAAWIFWLAIFAAIAGNALLHPLKHTTMPTYRLAAAQWWAGQDVYSYDSHAGFLYFPQAAFLFTPFAFIQFLAGEVLWRAAVFSLFAWAIWRMCREFLIDRNVPLVRQFLFVSLLAVPSSLASLRNAQFDLPLAALIVLAAAETGAGRWNIAAFWLCLGIALKPLALVPMLLFTALYWKLIPRVAVGMLIVAALPFLHWSPAYVAHEYRRCFETLVWAAQPNEPKFSDLAALAAHFSITLAPWLLTTWRLIFALVYLGLGALGLARLTHVRGAWLVGALSADYLMLFNPRTETCSFVVLGPFVAALALYYAGEMRRRVLAWVLGAGALGLACDALPVVHDYTDRWLKPLLALLFLPVLVYFIFDASKNQPARQRAANVR